jgi:adenylate cyclase
MSASVVATVRVTFPDGTVRVVELRDGDSARVGRMEGADIRLEDVSVSRAHAMFSASTSGVVVSDLSSTNGTYVNGRAVIAPVDLQASDVVDIGPFKLSVMLSGTEAANATTVSGRTMTAQLRPTQTVVLVARLRGFRGMKATLPQVEVDALWTRWRDLVCKVVEGTAGKVDKILDECILAVWYGIDGTKVSSNAVRAAQQIDLLTRQYSVGGVWEYHDRFPLTCSLALNAGLALMGSVGGKAGSREFAVLGDTVNVAFKLAEVTEALAQSVFISQDIAQQLVNTIRMQQVAVVPGEGEADPVEVFAVQI